jgi:hypothetical protein
MKEIWKPIAGFENTYEISNHGRVRNKNTKHIKPQHLHSNGAALYVQLWIGDKAYARRVHRLVLQTFIGPCPLGMEGCHNDGNFRNNHLGNLRWDTPANNHADKLKHGTSNRGERCGTHKLTKEQALAIISDPRPQKEIAADYGIRQSAVSRIKSGVRWPELHQEP